MSDQEVAKRLDDGKIAVIPVLDGKRGYCCLHRQQDERGGGIAYRAQSRRSNNVTICSISCKSAEVPADGRWKFQGQLTCSFQKRDEKRKPGDKPVVASRHVNSWRFTRRSPEGASQRRGALRRQAVVQSVPG